MPDGIAVWRLSRLNLVDDFEVLGNLVDCGLVAAQLPQRRPRVLDQAAEDPAVTAELDQRRLRARLVGHSAESLFEAVAEPAHRLIADRGGGALQRVHVPERELRGFDLRVAGEAEIDRRQAILQLGLVRAAHVTGDGLRLEVVGRERPRPFGRGFAVGEAPERAAEK